MFVTPAVGLCAMLAVIRGLRGDKHLGNFYVDLLRGLVFVLRALLPGRRACCWSAAACR